MSNDRIIVVGVPRCRPSDVGTQMDIETDQGERIELAMTAEAFRQWTEGCACPSKQAATPVETYECAAGPEHVAMTLASSEDTSAEFLLSHGDAVLLATRLLQAAKDARNQAPQG